MLLGTEVGVKLNTVAGFMIELLGHWFGSEEGETGFVWVALSEYPVPDVPCSIVVTSLAAFPIWFLLFLLRADLDDFDGAGSVCDVLLTSAVLSWDVAVRDEAGTCFHEPPGVSLRS